MNTDQWIDFVDSSKADDRPEYIDTYAVEDEDDEGYPDLRTYDTDLDRKQAELSAILYLLCEEPNNTGLRYQAKLIYEEYESMIALRKNSPTISKIQLEKMVSAMEPTKQLNMDGLLASPMIDIVRSPSFFPVDISKYKDLPELKDKSESLIKHVATIDTTTNITGAVDVVTFGRDIQSRIGRVLEKASTTGNRMVSLDITGITGNVIGMLKSLSIDNYRTYHKKRIFLFIKKSVPWKVCEYIDAYNSTALNVDSIVSDLSTKTSDLMSMMVDCESLFKENDELIEELDAHIIAGKMILSRMDKSNSFIVDQFDSRISSLSTYESLCLISFEQLKLTQRNLMQLANQAQDVVTVSYPLWKNAFSSLIQKWQSRGISFLNRGVFEVEVDQEYNFVKMHASKITESLSVESKTKTNLLAQTWYVDELNPDDAHNYMQSQIIQRNQGTQGIQWNQGYQGYSGYQGSYFSNVQNTVLLCERELLD